MRSGAVTGVVPGTDIGADTGAGTAGPASLAIAAVGAGLRRCAMAPPSADGVLRAT
ncbi:hypothetical protein GCM10009679_61890 [Saccharothrix algeriensis]|uniref:Uncharacterized protein n=1 Tax=Catellatospora bangladeshensis TaxID=310355 RepID=A0A8J3JLU5_9ACTN|nr:hypothetical protein Cba03nite_08280 [Catellatospora bangladeshensis]